MKADSTLIEELLDSNISGWQIEKDSGVSRTMITRLRNKKAKIKNLTFETASKLTEYKKKRTN